MNEMTCIMYKCKQQWPVFQSVLFMRYLCKSKIFLTRIECSFPENEKMLFYWPFIWLVSPFSVGTWERSSLHFMADLFWNKCFAFELYRGSSILRLSNIKSFSEQSNAWKVVLSWPFQAYDKIDEIDVKNNSKKRKWDSSQRENLL